MIFRLMKSNNCNRHINTITSRAIVNLINQKQGSRIRLPCFFHFAFCVSPTERNPPRQGAPEAIPEGYRKDSQGMSRGATKPWGIIAAHESNKIGFVGQIFPITVVLSLIILIYDHRKEPCSRKNLLRQNCSHLTAN